MFSLFTYRCKEIQQLLDFFECFLNKSDIHIHYYLHIQYLLILLISID